MKPRFHQVCLPSSSRSLCGTYGGCSRRWCSSSAAGPTSNSGGDDASSSVTSSAQRQPRERSRHVSVHEHAALDGIYTIVMESKPANVLTLPLLQELNGALAMLGEASVDPLDDVDRALGLVRSPSKHRRKRKSTSSTSATGDATDAEVAADSTAESSSSTSSSPVAALRKRNRPRGIILTSMVPGCFSGGLDLDVLATEPLIEPRVFSRYWHEFQATWMLLQSLPIPVVAAINGHAPAAGCILAAACDARVMMRRVTDRRTGRAKPTTIGVTAARAGFAAPPWVGADLNRLVGARIAEEMMQTGYVLSAEEAASTGLVDTLVDVHHDAANRVDVKSGDEPFEDTVPSSVWSVTKPRTGCHSLTGASLDLLLNYTSTPTYAYWLIKDTMRRPVVVTLPDSREGRAADAMRFYASIASPEAREKLLAYRATIGGSGAAAAPSTTSNSNSSCNS